MSHILKRNQTRLIYVWKEKKNKTKLKIFISLLFLGKKSWNLKCKFKCGFSIVLYKINSVFWFHAKKVFWDLKSMKSKSSEKNCSLKFFMCLIWVFYFNVSSFSFWIMRKFGKWSNILSTRLPAYSCLL